MNTPALRRQLPFIKLSATAMGMLLLAGTVFLLIRYFRLTAHGESFATAFETGRMLVNFGGMALLSPIVYWVAMLAIKRPGFRVLFYVAGLLGFAMAYLLLNKVMLSLMGQGQVSIDFWKGGKKLFINFGHILVLSYAAMLYGSMALIQRNRTTGLCTQGRSDSRGIMVKTDGLNRTIPLVSISHILANDHYLRVYSGNTFYMIRNSVSSILSGLGTDFIRIHRSTIINTRFVQNVVKKEGRIWVQMQDGSQHRVSARYEKLVLELRNPH